MCVDVTQTPPPTVEQRHRDAAADYLQNEARFFDTAIYRQRVRDGLADENPLVQAFARFDTERTAELEREIAALNELLDEASAYVPLELLERMVARNALGGQP